jgi:hypothetical protein
VIPLDALPDSRCTAALALLRRLRGRIESRHLPLAVPSGSPGAVAAHDLHAAGHVTLIEARLSGGDHVCINLWPDWGQR